MSSLSQSSVQYLKGVGPARKKLFENLGVLSLEDLLYLFPRRYEDRTKMTPLSQLKVGEFQTVTGRVMARGGRQSWYTRKHVYETVIGDDKGRLFAVWFNQPYLERYFQVNQQVILYGKVDVFNNRLQMVSPEYELIDSEEDQRLNMGRIVPIYPLTRGMSQRYLRKIMRACLDRYRDDMEDILPVWLRNKQHLPNIHRSLENIHFPENSEQQLAAQERVSFEEFFLFQLSIIKRRQSIVRKEGIAHAISLELLKQFVQSLPFPLTTAQNRVIREITADMQKPSPMLRLLQGDVGSGKTLVALWGCLAAVRSGYQAAIMAPTEILARQHYMTVKSRLANGSFADLRIGLLVNSMKKNDKDETLTSLKNRKIDILIGTHALLTETVDFACLSFIVIDEQHKFGVQQRALLSAKGRNPDVLVMTATPIPRTLSLTLFGDLDVSVLDELPPGRGQVITRAFTSEQVQEVYAVMRDQVSRGEQCYIVYPIIEESETLDLKAAEKMFARFSRQEFKNFQLGLIHGQMKREESDETMRKFKNKEIQILVATTVLEVGVDVPSANVMVIEHAERFGLSQLHQLRGRIARGGRDGLCLLVADPVTEEARQRIEAILSTRDGFKIAEQDLLIRGPGHYFGRHQHGLNELRFANPVTQVKILEKARHEAEELIHRDPDFQEGPHRLLFEVIKKRYPSYLDFAEAG